MKNIVITFFSTALCVSFGHAQVDVNIHPDLATPLNIAVDIMAVTETTAPRNDTSDQLASLRAQVAQQVEQINSILKTLCETVTASSLRDKEQLCRELGLVCDCMQTIAQSIPDMNKQALISLVELNSIVLTQLEAQLNEGTIGGLCNFTAAQFTTPQQQTRSFVTIEQLHEKVFQLQEQIKNVWMLVTSVSLATYAEHAQKTSSSLWQKIKNNKSTFAVSLSALVTSGLLYKYCDAAQRKVWIERFLNYSLMALYILRQKKDADIAPLAHSWFGQDSLLADAMVRTKQFIGSPKEKLPALHVIAHHERDPYYMSAKDQIKWGEDQNCTVLKIEKCRDSNFIKNFFDLEDGLFKLPVSFFFAYQVKEDMKALSEFFDAGANGFFKRLADLIGGKK